VTEHHPNALAWRRPPRFDPFPEEPEPLVQYFASDTPRERRAAAALEAATRRALTDPRAP